MPNDFAISAPSWPITVYSVGLLLAYWFYVWLDKRARQETDWFTALLTLTWPLSIPLTFMAAAALFVRKRLRRRARRAQQ